MEKKKSKLKKNIQMFLNSEEGKMLDADIVKTGIAMGIIGAAMSESSAQISTQVHANYFTSTQHVSHMSHGSHASHSSHGSHASHGSHGSHASHASHGSHGSHSSHGSHASHASHGSHARGGWC